ncbi:MAG: hypothetical protein D6771_07325 [Zetaproteobacteria bacterium]|nr:MAG: hypothetical protein D6771_07325 [Zetaproteobacteria bacterium]
MRLSKRAGNIVALDELVREVGKDAVRFNMLTRRAEAQFAFDIALAKAQTEDNPVFYVQYAHARICAILRRAEEAGAPIVAPDAAALERLTAPEEAELVAKLADWPEVVAEAASRLEPHRIANYAMELAAAFHAFYHQHRVIVEDEALAAARLVLVRAVKHVLAEALGLAGVDAPERM